MHGGFFSQPCGNQSWVRKPMGADVCPNPRWVDIAEESKPTIKRTGEDQHNILLPLAVLKLLFN